MAEETLSTNSVQPEIQSIVTNRLPC